MFILRAWCANGRTKSRAKTLSFINNVATRTRNDNICNTPGINGPAYCTCYRFACAWRIFLLNTMFSCGVLCALWRTARAKSTISVWFVGDAHASIWSTQAVPLMLEQPFRVPRISIYILIFISTLIMMFMFVSIFDCLFCILYCVCWVLDLDVDLYFDDFALIMGTFPCTDKCTFLFAVIHAHFPCTDKLKLSLHCYMSIFLALRNAQLSLHW